VSRSAEETVGLVLESLKLVQNGGLAPHTSFTASKDLRAIARRESILLTTHSAESREEMEMFRDRSGALYEFLKSIGRPMDDC